MLYGGHTGLRYYGNYHFLKRDLENSVITSSAVSILNLARWRENLNFTDGNPGFEEKIDGISIYINMIYHGLL